MDLSLRRVGTERECARVLSSSFFPRFSLPSLSHLLYVRIRVPVADYVSPRAGSRYACAASRLWRHAPWRHNARLAERVVAAVVSSSSRCRTEVCGEAKRGRGKGRDRRGGKRATPVAPLYRRILERSSPRTATRRARARRRVARIPLFRVSCST